VTAASSVPAKWHNVTTKGCKSNGSACTYTAPDTAPLPDGTTTVGFSLRAPSSGASETATLTWAIPDPEIGYIDAGDEACNTSFAQHLSLENEKTKVPLSKLLSYEPQTYTINGVRHGVP
jgi:hypothetical protein